MTAATTIPSAERRWGVNAADSSGVGPPPRMRSLEAMVTFEQIMAGLDKPDPEERQGEAKAPNGIEFGQRLAKLPPDEREREWRTARQAEIVNRPDDEVPHPITAALFSGQDVWAAEGPAREPVPGGCGLLHRGVPVMFYGERGGGKSTLALTLALSAAGAGERVLYLDREHNPTRARITDALKARDDWREETLRERFVGRYNPELRRDWKPADFGDVLAAERFAVVVFDSVRAFTRHLGLNPDSETEYSAMHELLGEPLAERGITPVFLDNVGHKEKGRPRGSSAKLDATPQGFQVTTPVPFSPERAGTIKVVCTRSRYGDIDRAWRMSVGGGLWQTPQNDEVIQRLLKELPLDGAWMPANDLAAAIGRDRMAVRRNYIEPAEEAGAVETTHAGGRGVLMVRRRDDYHSGEGLSIL